MFLGEWVDLLVTAEFSFQLAVRHAGRVAIYAGHFHY